MGAGQILELRAGDFLAVRRSGRPRDRFFHQRAAEIVGAGRKARRETVETYIKRLEQLEHIADEFSGVDKAYAIQAGREIRVVVTPEKVSDAEAAQLARDVATRVEAEVTYPGQIKVTVVRETRAVATAK